MDELARYVQQNPNVINRTEHMKHFCESTDEATLKIDVANQSYNFPNPLRGVQKPRMSQPESRSVRPIGLGESTTDQRIPQYPSLPAKSSNAYPFMSPVSRPVPGNLSYGPHDSDRGNESGFFTGLLETIQNFINSNDTTSNGVHHSPRGDYHQDPSFNWTQQTPHIYGSYHSDRNGDSNGMGIYKGNLPRGPPNGYNSNNFFVLNVILVSVIICCLYYLFQKIFL
eukprot:TRINITY_DN6054_c0_g1_i5.p1 TRINITY_DN6054_c0_g1~~TRINITY_DN6054_c0_g1_i5.p1  ORF type:complete len:226 (+),score=35.71 TRINITY_DN6054_c0_g1_i5:1254-1931(+)